MNGINTNKKFVTYSFITIVVRLYVFITTHHHHQLTDIYFFFRRKPKQDICGTVLLYEADTEYQTPMASAQVVFRYPIVGRVVFRQPQDRPWEDTVIIVESMVSIDKNNIYVFKCKC